MARYKLHDREVEVSAGKFSSGLPCVVLSMVGVMTVRLTLADAETLAEAMVNAVRAAEEADKD